MEGVCESRPLLPRTHPLTTPLPPACALGAALQAEADGAEKKEAIAIQRTIGRKAPVKYYVTGAAPRGAKVCMWRWVGGWWVGGQAPVKYYVMGG